MYNKLFISYIIKKTEMKDQDQPKKKVKLKSLLKQSTPPLFSVPAEEAIKTIEENKRRLRGS
jgi:hypothetical protein